MSRQSERRHNRGRLTGLSSSGTIQEWAGNVKPETRTDLQAYIKIVPQCNIPADMAMRILRKIINTEDKEQILGTSSSVNQCEETDYDSTDVTKRMIQSSSSAMIQAWANNVRPETRSDLQAYFDIVQQYDISPDIAMCTLQQVINTEGKEEEPSPYTTKQGIELPYHIIFIYI